MLSPSRKGGVIDGVHDFDWRAFAMLPREARHTDPQHRLLLELTWEALEDAGIPVRSLRGARAGVFAGIQWNDFARLLARDWSRLDGYAAIGNDFAFAANRISYTFGLTGPSFAVNCGCASALAALQLACQSLWAGDCEMAIAAGVELILAPESSLLISAMGLTSKQGRCRTLDVSADGFARSEGAGLVILKPVSRLGPGDRPYALVRGVALNHNGHNEWISASSAEAQQRAIREACRGAGVDPSALAYVELHAPGNPRGDAVELGALLDAVGTRERGRPCLVGSIKPNLGYAGCASGMASLIKVALAFHHDEIPPSIAPRNLHPDAAARAGEFEMPTVPAAWPGTRGKAFAGVTAISLGGANAHVVLSAARRLRAARPAGVWHLLPLSAAGDRALADYTTRFAAFLRASGEPLQDIVFTAAARRSHYSSRVAVVGRSKEELAAALELALGRIGPEPVTSPLQVLWRFGDTGPGERVERSDAYREEPAFRAAFRRLEGRLSAAARCGRGRWFCAQIASARLWKEWGVPCDGIVGDGRGALAAAYFAGERSWRQASHSLRGDASPLPLSFRSTPCPPTDCYTIDIGASFDGPQLLATLGEIYERGAEVNWGAVCRCGGRVVSLPAYPWQRERMWPAGLDASQINTPPGGLRAAGDLPEGGDSTDALRNRLRAAASGGRPEPLREYVRQRVGGILGSSVLAILEDHRALTGYGLDSLSSAALKMRVESDLGVSLPARFLLQAATVENLAAHLAEQFSIDSLLRSVSAESERIGDGQEVIRI